MTKYRIRKEVRADELLGRKEDGLYVKYHIQEKILWWWVDLKHIRCERFNIFDTVEAAEKALKKHVAIENELASDGKIMNTYKL